MSENFKVIAISGSLRKGSYNTALLRAVHEISPPDMDIEIVHIGHLPLFNMDLITDGMPLSVNALAQKIAAANGVLFASPEYNYSVPGVLKNAIDWLSRVKPNPFEWKAVAIMGASPGLLGTARMQYHLRQIMVSQNAYVVNRPEIMITQAGQKFDEHGRLTDDKTHELLGKQLEALRELSRRLRA